MLDSGGVRHRREGIPWIHCTSLPLGTCLYRMEYSVLTLYMSSQSWHSCGFFCMLWLVDVPVLSNFVCAGSFHPKPTQDHKVSICITLMCMMISCWCTYCLQAGFMNVKVHFLWCIYIICSDAYSQDTCNSLLALSCLCIHMLLHSIFTWLHTCRGSLCMLHVFPKL